MSLPATVTVYFNGVAQRSTSVTLVPPPPAALIVRAADVDVAHEATGTRIAVPLPPLSFGVGDATVVQESLVAGYRPVVTFTQEIHVSDLARASEAVVA